MGMFDCEVVVNYRVRADTIGQGHGEEGTLRVIVASCEQHSREWLSVFAIPIAVKCFLRCATHHCVILSAIYCVWEIVAAEKQQNYNTLWCGGG